MTETTPPEAYSADAQPAGGGSEGISLAVAAEVLYLLNLMVVPGIAFAVIVWLWLTKRETASAVDRCHLDQVFFASLWAGVLLVIANVAIILLGGYDTAYTWVVVILYFTICHSTLIFFRAFGLSRALSNKPYRYPLIGRPCRVQDD